MAYRYIGNKTRLADWIVRLVRESLPAGATIADLMCGTGSMSTAFARAGYRVIAADLLKFPVLHAQARLLTEGRTRLRIAEGGYDAAIQSLNYLPEVEGFFWREYSDAGLPANGARPRKYFTATNAGKIDAMRAAIRHWREQGLDDLAADLLLHELILAVNKVANIAGTYGFYRSKFSRSSLASINITAVSSEFVGHGHMVKQGEAAEVVPQLSCDALYIDPPYTKRQYGGNYHILETLASEDEPELAGEGGLRDWSLQASDFCYRRRCAAAFRKVLDQCRSRWVFISYSEDAHLSGSELTNLLANYGNVERHERPLDRYRSNERVAKQGAVREDLYVLEMKDAI